MTNVYIYCLWTVEEKMRYVGRTVSPKRRSLEHGRIDINTPVSRWVRKCEREGCQVYLTHIDVCSESQWPELEQYWIAYWRARGMKLLNISKGGEGCYGMKRSEEHKEAIRQHNRTRIITEETRRKMSEAAKRRTDRVAWNSGKTFKKGSGRPKKAPALRDSEGRVIRPRGFY